MFFCRVHLLHHNIEGRSYVTRYSHLCSFPTKSQWRRCRAPGGHRNLPKVGFWNLNQRRRERCYSGGGHVPNGWNRAKNRTPFDRSLMKTSIFWKMLKRIPAFFWGEFFTYCVLVFFREKPKTGYKFIELSADFLGERTIRVRGADVEQRVMSGIYDILLV